MYRVALRLAWHPAPRCAEDAAPLWTVAKCYDMRAGEDHALPVKVSTDHGRKRLLILCPERVQSGTYSTPYELLRAYLHALPEAEKRRRALEMRAMA